MSALLDPLLAPFTAEPAGRMLLGWGISQFMTFTLVMLRIAGLMTIGPLYGNRTIPMRAKALLAMSVAALLTPTLPYVASVGFTRLDLNGDGRIERSEVPEPLSERFERRLADVGRTSAGWLHPSEWPALPRLPGNIADFAKIAATEFSLGLALGLGVATLLSGLQFAGEMIDQQTGIALSEVFNPGFEELDGSVTGRFLFLFGTIAFLTMPPLDGHLVLMSAIVETFQTMPVAEASLTEPTIDLLSELVHVSLVLALQVAAPILATMSLVALSMGFLGHTVPQVNVFINGFPIRAAINLGVLALTFSGAAAAVVEALTVGIDGLRHSLTALP
ncbi:MAG: flagellar biosynthetic protein FliR [Planctomycetaceae bacterium]|nr:flagellar biosynthetic protein FliR [Planctomycetaceae bacterium]